MFPAKRFKTCILLLSLVILPSCSAFDYFKSTPAEHKVAETAADQAENYNDPAADDDIRGGTASGSDVKGKETHIENLEEKIVLLENKVNTLESQVAGQKKIVYTVEYSDPAQLYKEARTLLLAKEIDNAADLFSTFAKKHPDHALADNAMYWLGECHYTKGNYKTAVTVFKDLVKKYPRAEKVPDAMLKTGYAYLSMDDINRASHFLTKVIKKYPFSPAAEKAQVKLKEFQ
ncbi:MAG: tol-pal system protein YbgF [Desulfobacterales bacterium]|nr:tol-pal system protein YbgF [Desulfobacterales bacterium]